MACRLPLFAVLATLIFCGCASGPAYRASSGADASAQRLATRLHAHMRALEHRGFSGAALVELEGQTLLRAGYGLSDRDSGSPITPATVFHIGSLGKSFTAAAVLRLEADGLLQLDDPLTRFFDDVPADKARISLRQLLTHSSGLPDRALPCSRAEVGALDRSAYVRAVLAAPLQARPGETYRYANSGYDLLGAVIERVSGQDYASYLRSAVLEPAGLNDTGIALGTWQAPERIAVGYRADGRRWGTLHTLFWGEHGALWCNLASGALLSTLDDLARWPRILAAGQVLPLEQVRAMWSPQVVEDATDGSHYGFGFMLAAAPGLGPRIAHSGSLSGVLEAELHWYPERELLLVVASTTEGHGAGVAMAGLLRLLQPPRPERRRRGFSGT